MAVREKYWAGLGNYLRISSTNGP